MFQTRKHSIYKWLDITLFTAGILFLVFSFITHSRLNISADSVDYYAILQELTPEDEKPLVDNSHFIEQRSPGYSVLALIPWFTLDLIVEPFVETERISDYSLLPEPGGRPHRMPREGAYRPNPGEDFSEQAGMSSEFASIPPIPLNINSLLFRDFHIEQHDSWYQWKIALSLLLTSLFFLIIGFFMNYLLLKELDFKFRFLIPLVFFLSPVLMKNMIDFPLYSTLTIYGLSSAFIYFLIRSYHSSNRCYYFLSGLSIGLLVLTRFETILLLFPPFIHYLAKRDFPAMKFTIAGGSIAFILLMVYNLIMKDVLLDFSILQGDINTLSVDSGFLLANLFHPDSGILIWTPLIIPGIILLFFMKNSIARIAGSSALLMLILYLIKIPIMYFHLGEGMMEIGGIPVHIPPTMDAMRFLIRSDINRYVVVILPFALTGIIMGLKNLLDYVSKKRTENYLKQWS